VLVTPSVVPDKESTFEDVMFSAKVEMAVVKDAFVVANTFAAELSVLRRPVVSVTPSFVAKLSVVEGPVVLETLSVVPDNRFSLEDVIFAAEFALAAECVAPVVENTFAAELSVVKGSVVLVTTSLVSDKLFTLVDEMFDAKFEVAVESEPLVENTFAAELSVES